MKKIFLLLVFHLAVVAAQSQYAKLYPTNWFTGMRWNKVQVLVRGEYEGFAREKVRINYPGVTLVKTTALGNSKYMALDLVIDAAAKPGEPVIEFLAGAKVHAVKWPIKPKRNGRGINYAQGINSADFIYFLMPDRFSNGDESNDRIAGLRDQSLNRDSFIIVMAGTCRA
jgi:hypothetical protein